MILFYAGHNNQVVETLDQQLAGHGVVRCRSLSLVGKKLRRPRHGLEILLAVVDDAVEMSALEKMQSLLRDLRLVVVLPHRDALLVSRAHRLTPRFIAYADYGAEQILSVLEKMIHCSADRLPCRAASAEQLNGKNKMSL